MSDINYYSDEDSHRMSVSLAIFCPPIPIEVAKNEDGIALSWAEYQREVHKHNSGLLLNQRQWTSLIRAAELSSGIDGYSVTLSAFAVR